MNREPDETSLAALQLNMVKGLGPRLQQLLLERFGTPQEIFQASGKELLSVSGIGPKVSTAISQCRDLEQARTEWQQAHDAKIQIFDQQHTNYPSSLREVPDPPPVLYVRGELRPEDELAVAIVGSRTCTMYGLAQAERLAGSLARAGVTIISGLARGIDAAAHRGALQAGGRTIAVCATGLNKVYPPEHAELAFEIKNRGALVSESPLHRGPSKGLFPQRNRIISGLSLGVLIVEASERSGALHTARHAMEQGREVFALPGRIDSLASAGCHNLIRDGAVLVRNVDDILESLGPAMQPVKTNDNRTVMSPRELMLDDQESTILNLIDTAPTSIDSILAQAEIESSRALSTLTVLEMRRLIRRLPGGFVERTYG